MTTDTEARLVAAEAENAALRHALLAVDVFLGPPALYPNDPDVRALAELVRDALAPPSAVREHLFICGACGRETAILANGIGPCCFGKE